MRGLVVAVGGGLVASACAAIVGLDDPAVIAESAEGGDTGTIDATAATDAPVTDGGRSDADASRSCTGPVLKTDTFDDRSDPAAGWDRNYRGDGGTIEISNGRLHVYVPAPDGGANTRRQLDVSKPMPQRMCATFTVEIAKPQSTTGFPDNGDTIFGFIAPTSTIGDASPTYYDGVGLKLEGPFAYVFRTGTDPDDNQLLAVSIASKWHVYMSADFVANTVTFAVNDREATFGMARPPAPPTEATFSVGIRSVGLVPESEAFFDDVVVTAE